MLRIDGDSDGPMRGLTELTDSGMPLISDSLISDEGSADSDE
jgi:hypothetical protein